ncbi:SAM-dependent methyltransferase [Sphingopyxis sp.]|uniref:SAM-dependent methyltransferase n=1 Tax=Sphingopyxis sp. TaxID=1908224 RepID=UPI003D0EEE16
MRYSTTTPAGILWMSPAAAVQAVAMQGARNPAEKDRRWPAMLRKLKGLRKRGRHSIRIVDADCGAGELLIHAVRRARELGFVAIEGRGIDSDPRLIADARQAAARQADPAIGLIFEKADLNRAMREETEFPADLLLCPACKDDERELAKLAHAAGETVFWDRPTKHRGEKR